MTARFRSRSTVAPQVLRASSAPAPRTCVSGREGKGREEEWKDVVLIHLQTVPARLGEWMTADAASIGGVPCR